MKTYQVTASALIDAPATQIYAIFADYHEGHRAVLPTRYFTNMTVTQGGYGAGTEIDVQMQVFGAKAFYHMKVSEPEPGRVLQEEDLAAGVCTTFTVEPVHGDNHSRVTIATTMSKAPGLKGQLEAWMNPPIMRRIYREELAQLEAVLETHKSKT